ncbi:MAG: histidinol-phosphate transaminase [Coriobacteriia bacterium]|nr:histidinol-phosphate transaminase [Coriobacteriia bacterium]
MQWQKFFRQNLEAVQPYQPGLREEQVRNIAKVDTIYKLSSNENPLPPFPSAIQAMADSLTKLNEYPDGSAYHLTQLLSQHYNVPAEQIILGNGSNELIDLIAQSCLEPGDNVVYCAPSFTVYQSSALIAGADIITSPVLPDGSYDLPAIKAAINEHTKIVYVCTPNNPTGGIVTHKDLAAFLVDLPEHVLVVVDAAYEEFIVDPDAALPLEFFDGIRPYVILRTFSKMYSLAGIRMGYGFAPEPIVENVSKVRNPFNVNSVAQAAAQASLDDAAEVERRRQANADGRNRLYDCFSNLGISHIPSQGNFIWIEVPDAQKTFEDLLTNGIIVRSFGHPHGLRVGVGDEAGVSATIQVFEKLFSLV